jgi:hypothetical protein
MTDEKRDSRGRRGPGEPTDVTSSATRIPKQRATFPPERWSGDVISKTTPPLDDGADQDTLPTRPGRPRGAGPEPITERDARQLLTRRFLAAGFEPVFDYALRAPGVALLVDAYDPKRHAGYIYLSHADADVVSDLGAAEELALQQLSDAGTAHVLVVHDRDVDSLAALEHRADAFLASLRSR